MKRLTERLESGVINVKYASQHETAIHRLVTIEDILGDEYDLDRLRELVQADREGRCVVLPRLEPGQGDPIGDKGVEGSPGLCPNCNDYRGLVWDKVTGCSRCTICGWTNAKT